MKTRENTVQEPIITLIVAAAHGRVIGKANNTLPWPRIKQDMAHFKKMTIDHPVIMGRVTFETFPKDEMGFPRPLPKRKNIVVTRDSEYIAPPSVWLASSIEDAIEMASFICRERIFILGGQQIYEQTATMADEVYYTDIDLEVEGTTFFPDIFPEFEVADRQELSEEIEFPDGTVRSVDFEIQKWVRK